MPSSHDTAAHLPTPGAFERYRSRTFSSLKQRNYRLYFIGQGVSLCGTWMQSVAQSWLVLTLTHSGALLGVATALQFLPVLLLAPYGGLLADRVSKRKLLFFTQSAAATLALGLGVLVFTGAIRLWMVLLFSLALGTINAIDNPTRQSFVHELAGPQDIKNAVTLNSLEVNLSRIIGPAIAGLLIAGVGMAPCFLINGASFIAVLVCLWLMRSGELYGGKRVPAARGQLVEGFRYVLNSPVILAVLAMMALVGTLTYEFQVTLPLLARFTFHGGADTYALLTSTMGVGAVTGGLVIAGRRRSGVGVLAMIAIVFGLATGLVALAPTLVWATAGMLLVGACSIAFTSITNTILQMEAAPEMRGRVMSLWTMAFLGSTLVGAPIVGWVGQHFDPRWGLGTGAIAATVAGVLGLAAVRIKRSRDEASAAVPIPATIAEKEDYV